MSRLPRLSFTPIIIGAAALAMTYLGFTTTHYVLHDYHLGQQETQVRTDIKQLDQDHANLVAVRDYLKSDEYIQDVARRVLGLVRPGETLVVVSSDEPAAATATPAIAARNPDDWWKDLFIQPAVTPTAGP